MDGTLIYVDVKRSPVWRRVGRPQRWYWIALSGENFERLARSTEHYTNREDCYHAAEILFGERTYAYRREAEQGNVRLRLASVPNADGSEPKTVTYDQRAS